MQCTAGTELTVGASVVAGAHSPTRQLMSTVEAPWKRQCLGAWDRNHVNCSGALGDSLRLTGVAGYLTTVRGDSVLEGHRRRLAAVEG